MLILVALVLVVAFLLWRRRRRQAVLAGRDAERPTYSIDPPTRRRLGSLGKERL